MFMNTPHFLFKSLFFLSFTSTFAQYYQPQHRIGHQTFLVGDRIFFEGGTYFTEGRTPKYDGPWFVLFYLELGHGQFQLSNPPFYLLRDDIPDNFDGMSIVGGKDFSTGVIFGGVWVRYISFICVVNSRNNRYGYFKFWHELRLSQVKIRNKSMPINLRI